MIIYIHGFASSGLGGKALLFKDKFKKDIFIPSLSYVPTLAINTLEQLIEIFINKGEKVSLVGSSLGGYYAIYLANKYSLKAVLINPAIRPYKTLEKVGLVTNYYDMSKFEVKNEHLKELINLKCEVTDDENFMLLLQKEDDILDYTEALKKLPTALTFLEEGGSHSFDGIERYFKKISQFLNNSE